MVCLACNSSSEMPKLEVEDDIRMSVIQRDTRVINGSKEKLELKLGDITNKYVTIDIIGQKSNQQFLHADMKEGDKKIIDYYGTKYVFNVLHFENHIIHDDKAEISFRKLNDQEAKTLDSIIKRGENKPDTSTTDIQHS